MTYKVCIYTGWPAESGYYANLFDPDTEDFIQTVAFDTRNALECAIADTYGEVEFIDRATFDAIAYREPKPVEISYDEWLDEMSGGSFTLDCGCNVEPDGTCYHGNESPLLALGLI